MPRTIVSLLCLPLLLLTGAAPDRREAGTRVHVGQDRRVRIGVVLATAPGGLDRLPRVRVTRQVGGFSCLLVSLRRQGPPAARSGARPAQERFELEVRWRPGADLSGCLIRVEDPVSGSFEDVEVMMNL